MKIFLLIISFMAIIFIKNLAFWSDSRTYLFGDTAIYSLQLTSLAKNIGTILSPKDSIFLWNPNYLSVGLPTLSLVDYGISYPPNLIISTVANLVKQPLLVFPLYEVSLLLHIFFGAYFIYKILKVSWNLNAYSSLIGSFIWIYNGFNLEWLGAGPILISACYLPICIYLVLKNGETGKKFYLYLHYLFLALSFLVGYPMVSLIILLIGLTLSFFLDSKDGGRTFFQPVKDHLIGLFLITLPLISHLYFSAAINLPYSVRNQLKLESFLQNPVPLLNLPEPLLPSNTLFNTLNRINSVYLYFSLVGILLLLQSKFGAEILKVRKNAVLLIIGAVGLIFSLGSTTFLPSLSYFVLPGMNLFRRLSVFSIVPNTVFAIFVAQAVRPAIENKSLGKGIIFWIKLLIILVIYTQILNIIYSSQKENPFTSPSLYQSLFLSVLITGVTLMAFFYTKTYPATARGLIILAILIEAGTVVSSKVYINSRVDPSKIFGPNSLMIALQKLINPMDRVDVLATQHSYSTDYLNLEQTQGYLSLASQYGVEINTALTSTDYSKKNLRDLLGVKYIVKKNSAQEQGLEKVTEIQQNTKNPQFFAFNYISSEWEPEESNTKYSIFKNPEALPRLFLAKKIVTGDEQTKEGLKEIEAYESPKVVQIKNIDQQGEITGDAGEVRIQEYKRNYIKAQVSNSGEAFLANSTAYYPGWWARVNGSFIKPIQANWFMMGIYLPPGKNTVEFFYIPYGIIAGSLYLLVALMYWAILALKNLWPVLPRRL